MSVKPAKAIEVFFSYSHKDEELRDELEKHLSILKRKGVITGWHDRRIGAGREWEGEIDTHLDTADVILLLISADFLASDYCYDVEMKRAMERHDAGEARVIPVILRPCDWEDAPFGKLQALPKDAVPVTEWPNRDKVFLNVAQGIRVVVEELTAGPHPASEKPSPDAEMATPTSVFVSSLVDILAELPPDAPLHERLGNVVMYTMGQVSMASIATGLQLLILLVLSGLWAWILAGGIGRDLQSWELIGIVWLGLTVLPLIAGTFPQSREEEIYTMFKLKKPQRLSLWLVKAFGIYVSAFLGETTAVVIWRSLVYIALWPDLSLTIKTIFWFIMALLTSALSLVGATIAVRYSWKLRKSGQAPRLRGEDVLLGLGFPLIVYPGMMFFGWITAPIWSQWQTGCPTIVVALLGLVLMLRREAKRQPAGVDQED